MNRKPNIILLVLDTHRAERMSLYGYHKNTTPVLDSLAQTATVFDWAIAPGQWTIPSHASMFTGLYPTVHQTNQSYASLPESTPTLAEILRKGGYKTVGFCNNPLVGVLENGLRRGFDQFYNYGTTFPDVPKIGKDRGLRKLQRILTDGLLKKISTPIERQFGRSPLLLKLATLPVFVPLWARVISFKGNTTQSLQDITDYLRYHHNSSSDQPLFVFVNMMETHLPYHPPPKVMDHWVPYFKRDREAREFLRTFNTQSYRWMAPVTEPLTDWQHQVLVDTYDAEVAYQDRLLRKTFRYLKRSGQLENTMLIVVSDHGESHGDHNFMGHAFSIYNELVRVPLIIHYPEMYPKDRRVTHPVSTRRVFHAILEAAGIEHDAYGNTVEELSLARSAAGSDQEPDGEYVVSEAYPPLNFINVMEMSTPEAIDKFRVRMMRRAIYEDSSKLMMVDERTDEFFDVNSDPLELDNLLDSPQGYENKILQLEHKIEDFVTLMEAHRSGTVSGERLDYSDNPEILERLRGLGYIE
ncbi:MAG: sulfatase [Anaerolineae bacterium]|nr:sulfatase [Anaerolineae bacterium]